MKEERKKGKEINLEEEFDITLNDNGEGHWWVGLRRKTDPNDCIYLLPSDSYQTKDYIIEKKGNTFCIYEKPEDESFKWTVESIAAIDWNNKPLVEILEVCAEHWKERIDAGNYSKDPAERRIWWGTPHCAACQKFNSIGDSIESDCYNKCPLGTENGCCNGVYRIFDDHPNQSAALSVLYYIKKILKQEREKERKAKEWKPEIGDKVLIVDHESNFHRQRGKVIGLYSGEAVLFNPEWKNGHSGYINISKGIGQVPGYDHAHIGVYFENLQLVKKGK